jgi:drug/metabolite transporter (DMT)-like permease
MSNIALFLTSAFIWGSTWLMITFQLGVVAPLISVVYRFFLASLILFGYCLWRRQSFSFSRSDHFWILVQGLMLFGFNYWLTYIGITKITSALAAILSTSIVYFNVVFARLFLGDKIKAEVVVGASIGVIGIILIFLPEVQFGQAGSQPNETIDWIAVFNSQAWAGIWMILAGSIFASLGNIASAKTQRRKIPVLQANALGMGYASILLALVATASGLNFEFEWTFSYFGSLIYLALFGSVIAFGAFLTLLGKIGPDKAGYISLVYPVIAMIFSTFFEGYQWTTAGVLGLFIILFGNYIAMGKYQQLPLFKKLATTASTS